MRKLIIGMLMVAAVAFSAMAQKTTLNFFYYIDATQAGYAEDQAMWQKFKDANPNIDLQMEMLFSQAFHQKLSSYIAAGQLPDVIYMWPTSRDSSKLLHDNHLMADLSKVLGADYLKSFSPAAVNAKEGSGYLAELPQAFTYTSVAYVNKKLLADNGIAVPKTYADLKNAVLKLRSKGIQTIALPDGDQWPAQSCLISTFVGRYLGDAWVDKVVTGKVKFTDKEFLTVLKQYKALYDDGIIDKSNVQIGYGEGPALFASGKAAIIVDGDWRLGAYLTDKTSGKALIDPKDQPDIELINFPALPGEKFPGYTSAIAGVGLGINKALTGAKLDAAKKLVQFYYSKEFQTLKWETGAFIPTRTDISAPASLEPLAKKLPGFYAANTKTSYVLDGVLDPSVFNILNAGLQSIPLGADTPEGVAQKMQAAQDKLLKK